MRTLVDIPAHQLEELNILGRERKSSRAALIRSAINCFLEKERTSAADEAFGMLAGRGIDGLEFQERMRREWERES